MTPETLALIAKYWGPLGIVLALVVGYFVKKEHGWHKERLENTKELLQVIKNTSVLLTKVDNAVENLCRSVEKLAEVTLHLRQLRRFQEHVIRLERLEDDDTDDDRNL